MDVTTSSILQVYETIVDKSVSSVLMLAGYITRPELAVTQKSSETDLAGPCVVDIEHRKLAKLSGPRMAISRP